MASVLIITTSSGVTWSCDAVCYDAKHETCVCVACGGVNHGVGREQAIVNTRTLHVFWVAGIHETEPTATFELHPEVQHLPLFPLPEETPCP